ncbi:MAG TPA: NAD+ synthase [Balneolaceae bacterium]|nr:NAD+ synthase [Balneolaceae bacterium]
MKMKVRIQQLNPTVGDLSGNTRDILSALKKAEKSGTDLLILPEMCTCGYTPMDLLENPAFLKTIDRFNKDIIQATRKTALIFGSVTLNLNQPGRPCFNAALMAQNGQKIAEVHKTLLPTYDVFDEDRYFERNDEFKCITWQGKKFGITICEDIWVNESSVQYYTYDLDPVEKLVDEGAEAIINISASPFTDVKAKNRRQMLKKHVGKHHCPIFYANQAGGHTELISDGDSMALNARAEIIANAPLFEEAFLDVEWDAANEVQSCKAESGIQAPERMKRIFGALQQGLRDYLEKTGVTSQVLIGLSGGIDSSLTACIAAEALGPENVMGVTMPSEFSSEGSVTDAEQLAKNLDIELREIPVKSLYDEYLDLLKPLFAGTEFGVAEENLQSRIRGVLLMAIANKFNRFVLNTGNKSELATGYCTLYGDTNGAVAVLSDLYKTEVFTLAHWLNKSYYYKEVIPQEILDKPPSAELRPDQKDTDQLPEYDTLDAILQLYIEGQQSISEIVDNGFEEKLVKRVIRLVHQNEYKRYQTPPGLKIHTKAFGTGRRWPIVQNWTNNFLE